MRSECSRLLQGCCARPKGSCPCRHGLQKPDPAPERRMAVCQRFYERMRLGVCQVDDAELSQRAYQRVGRADETDSEAVGSPFLRPGICMSRGTEHEHDNADTHGEQRKQGRIGQTRIAQPPERELVEPARNEEPRERERRSHSHAVPDMMQPGMTNLMSDHCGDLIVCQVLDKRVADENASGLPDARERRIRLLCVLAQIDDMHSVAVYSGTGAQIHDPRSQTLVFQRRLTIKEGKNEHWRKP